MGFALVPNIAPFEPGRNGKYKLAIYSGFLYNLRQNNY